MDCPCHPQLCHVRVFLGTTQVFSLLNFTELYLCVFLELFNEDCGCSLTSVLEFIYVILASMHFYRTGRVWRGDAGLIPHTVGVCEEMRAWEFLLPCLGTEEFGGKR